jgi:RNA-directed DNA polymerase
MVLGASPSKKSMQRLKAKVRDLLVPGNQDPWWEVRDTLNSILRGWSNYFRHGTRRPAFCGVDFYVRERVRAFLVRRHKMAGRGNTGRAKRRNRRRGSYWAATYCS